MSTCSGTTGGGRGSGSSQSFGGMLRYYYRDAA